jgi:hypothetical protein
VHDPSDSIDDRDFRVDEIRQIKVQIPNQDDARMDYSNKRDRLLL